MNLSHYFSKIIMINASIHHVVIRMSLTEKNCLACYVQRKISNTPHAHKRYDIFLSGVSFNWNKAIRRVAFGLDPAMSHCLHQQRPIIYCIIPSWKEGLSAEAKLPDSFAFTETPTLRQPPIEPRIDKHYIYNWQARLGLMEGGTEITIIQKRKCF